MIHRVENNDKIRILPFLIDGQIEWFVESYLVWVEDKVFKLKSSDVPFHLKKDISLSETCKWSIKYYIHIYINEEFKLMPIGRSLFKKIENHLKTNSGLFSFNDKLFQIRVSSIWQSPIYMPPGISDYSNSYIEDSEKLFDLSHNDFIEMIKSNQPIIKFSKLTDLAFNPHLAEIISNYRNQKIENILYTK